MEVDIEIPVPKGTRAKQLNVVIQKKKLSVGLKGQEPIMAGELCKEIKVDESTWNIGMWSCVTCTRRKYDNISQRIRSLSSSILRN
jgi:hypothetical protein